MHRTSASAYKKLDSYSVYISPSVNPATTGKQITHLFPRKCKGFFFLRIGSAKVKHKGRKPISNRPIHRPMSCAPAQQAYTPSLPRHRSAPPSTNQPYPSISKHTDRNLPPCHVTDPLLPPTPIRTHPFPIEWPKTNFPRIDGFRLRAQQTHPLAL